MKFGKRLKVQIEQTLPEWRNKFVSYKELKKLVKLTAGEEKRNSKRPRLEHNDHDPGHGKWEMTRSAEESEFVQLLNAEIEKFNSFFVEQEEEYIIRQKELHDRIDKLKTKTGPNGEPLSEKEHEEEMIKLRKDIVNFHGEMVLLENYSALNYTGIAKILKKYDKRTGGVLRQPFIQEVLQQPFFTTELLSNLVKQCEETLHSLFPEHPLPLPSPELQTTSEPLQQRSQSQEKIEKIYTSTVAALRTMRDIRKTSSTYSIFSLPPLNIHFHGFADENDNSIPSSSLIPLCPKT
ncbi:hypothetical protein SUGI_0055020 [Cryptomeria japonica]|uniref:SPX domain-containing protein 1 n=1 Tax=Cryptomeria japonica TaxID=3369 RepID=UPI002408E1FE|nr:SPX domain-containing protein 1 [Cryptomeria japonica]GLJ06997.1 hypothetical protein SUGI_0055020 [Cryptomeria japonica]